MIKTSVAMTTYNSKKYLIEQLNSIISQTIVPNEIIICDDKSEDNTHAIISNYIKNTNTNINIKLYINSLRLGFTQNFAQAIELCSGDIIFLADHDDVWFDNKVEECLSSFNLNPNILLIVHDAIITDKELTKTKTTMLEQVIRGYGNAESLVTGALTCFRKELIRNFLPIPKDIVGHDICIHNIGIYLGVRLVIPKPLQFIRRHESNYSNWIASSKNKINILDVLYNQLNTEKAKNYDDRLILNEYYKLNLNKSLSTYKNSNIKIIQYSLKYLEIEYFAIKLRNTIVNEKGIKRLVLILKMLFLNYYRFFNGYRSFIRDLFRI